MLASLCPDCWPGRQARALVLAEHFWENLAIALVPFVVVAFFTWCVRRALDGADEVEARCNR